MLVGDTLNKQSMSLSFEIERLSHRINSIYSALDVLRTYRVDDLVAMLHQEGYRFPFNADDPETYYKDLSRVSTRAKSLIVDLEQKEARLQALQDDKKGEKITREYFEQWLVALSKFMGHNLNEEEISVARYATILSMYNKHCEQLKASNEKRPNR